MTLQEMYDKVISMCYVESLPSTFIFSCLNICTAVEHRGEKKLRDRKLQNVDF